MKILIGLILFGMAYGLCRLILVLVKELVEIAAEAWHQGDVG